MVFAIVSFVFVLEFAFLCRFVLGFVWNECLCDSLGLFVVVGGIIDLRRLNLD